MRIVRYIRNIVLLTLVISLLAAGALADVRGSIRYTPDNGALEIRCRGLNAQREYALIVLRCEDGVPYALTEENALMVDQIKAGAGGELSVLMIYPGLPECAVLLGGAFEGEESPVMLGEPVYLENAFVSSPVLTAIGEEAFMGTSFHCVVISDCVTSIGAGAFSDCAELKTAIIPDSVTSIGSGAFSGCPDLEIICTEGSAAHEYAVANQIPCRLE